MVVECEKCGEEAVIQNDSGHHILESVRGDSLRSILGSPESDSYRVIHSGVQCDDLVKRVARSRGLSPFLLAAEPCWVKRTTRSRQGQFRRWIRSSSIAGIYSLSAASIMGAASFETHLFVIRPRDTRRSSAEMRKRS